MRGRSIGNTRWILAEERSGLAVPDREPTVRDLAELRSRSGRVVGTPEQIADVLERWREAGINVINNTIPGTYLVFIERLLPVLQERGLARREHTSAPGGGSSPVPTPSTTDIPLPPTEVPSPDR